jgi:hypothetical protein
MKMTFIALAAAGAVAAGCNGDAGPVGDRSRAEEAQSRQLLDRAQRGVGGSGLDQASEEQQLGVGGSGLDDSRPGCEHDPDSENPCRDAFYDHADK